MTLFPPDMVSDRNGVNVAGIVAAIALFALTAGIIASIPSRNLQAPAAPDMAASRNISARQPKMKAVVIEAVKESSLSSETEEAGEPKEQVAEKQSAAAPAETGATAKAPAKKAEPKVARATTAQRPARESRPMKMEETGAEPPAIREPARKPAARPERTKRESGESRLVTDIEVEKLEDVGAGVPPEVTKINSSSIGNKAINWYSVRVGFTESKLRADVLRDVLAGQGFPDAKTVKSSDNTYHVAVGNYRFKHEADDAAKKLVDKTGLSPRVFEKTVAE